MYQVENTEGTQVIKTGISHRALAELLARRMVRTTGKAAWVVDTTTGECWKFEVTL